ncbi:hypothetical protein V1512DRAFT_266619 [Lipomyces arxii]|uniref:uncharacterized protein n=1 Tax=Lipomyces arxii TaxID=56418 RepID=UPI0034CFAD2F
MTEHRLSWLWKHDVSSIFTKLFGRENVEIPASTTEVAAVQTCEEACKVRFTTLRRFFTRSKATGRHDVDLRDHVRSTVAQSKDEISESECSFYAAEYANTQMSKLYIHPNTHIDVTIDGIYQESVKAKENLISIKSGISSKENAGRLPISTLCRRLTLRSIHNHNVIKRPIAATTFEKSRVPSYNAPITTPNEPMLEDKAVSVNVSKRVFAAYALLLHGYKRPLVLSKSQQQAIYHAVRAIHKNTIPTDFAHPLIHLRTPCPNELTSTRSWSMGIIEWPTAMPQEHHLIKDAYKNYTNKIVQDFAISLPTSDNTPGPTVANAGWDQSSTKDITNDQGDRDLPELQSTSTIATISSSEYTSSAEIYKADSSVPEFHLPCMPERAHRKALSRGVHRLHNNAAAEVEAPILGSVRCPPVVPICSAVLQEIELSTAALQQPESSCAIV